MANQNNPQISARKDTVTIITDSSGNPIMEIGLHEYTVKHADGSRTHHRISETIELMCSTIWGPASKIPVGLCQQHRRKGAHGLVSMHRGRYCADGGELICPKHCKRAKDDQKWRCLRHHSTHLLKTTLRPILYKREED
jgi:hypothetical protein